MRRVNRDREDPRDPVCHPARSACAARDAAFPTALSDPRKREPSCHHAHPEHCPRADLDIVSTCEIERPSSPMQNSARLAGTVHSSAPSRTRSGMMWAATNSRPLGSMWKVRQWMPCVSMC